MTSFVESATDFSADCACKKGRCVVDRQNFLFLDNGKEIDAVDYLQGKCGYVVVIPDDSAECSALVHHTSCARMTDVVHQIFAEHLGPAVSLPQFVAEMTLGEMHRRTVGISYADCMEKVSNFDFSSTMAAPFPSFLKNDRKPARVRPLRRA